MSKKPGTVQLKEMARHYREMARRALEHAQRTQQQELKEEFTVIAYNWHVMALQAESLIAE